MTAMDDDLIYVPLTIRQAELVSRGLELVARETADVALELDDAGDTSSADALLAQERIEGMIDGWEAGSRAASASAS
jgi:hypothetical protein